MAFKGYKRSIKLEFDYNEIKEGIPNVKKQMAVLNAEFKKSSAEAQVSGKEIDKLGTKYDFLSNKIKIQEKEVENYRKKLETATNAKGNNTKAIENNTASLQIAEAKLAQTRAQLDKVTQELDKQKLTLGKTSEEWKKLGEKTTEIGKSMTMKLTVPILAAGAASFKLGADFEQAMGKMEVVFEDNSKAIEAWSRNSLRDFGLARLTATTMVSDFGALFKGMGIGLKQTEVWSKTLTERTMDLSNFYDTTIEETTNALNAIVTGQTQPLRKFGINMTQAALQEYALATGIKKKVSEMTEAEKVQLRYNFVIEKTNIAVGTTARESDSATGQLNRFKESVKELGVNFSEHVLPIITPVLEGINNMVARLSELSDGTKKFIVIGGLLVASVGPILIFVGSIFGAISNITSGLKLLSGGIKTVSGVLDTGAFVSFAKWAAIITVVVLALAALIYMINTLTGKSQDMNQFAGSMENMTSNIGNSMQKTSGAVQNAATRGYAVGTKYHPGGPSLVGEEGPEVVDLPRGSKVYTAQETKKMLNGSGDTYILQVSMDEIDEVSKLVKVFNDFKQTKKAGVVYG